nr:helix-turn-helix transcriptional regulator [uncultured Agathobaculum sp.]
MNPNLLRAKMAECGLSQGKTAALIGICENSLTRKLSGERDFKLSEVRSLCRVLNITDPARVFDLTIGQEGGEQE